MSNKIKKIRLFFEIILIILVSYQDILAFMFNDLCGFFKDKDILFFREVGLHLFFPTAIVFLLTPFMFFTGILMILVSLCRNNFNIKDYYLWLIAILYSFFSFFLFKPYGILSMT